MKDNKVSAILKEDLTMGEINDYAPNLTEHLNEFIKTTTTDFGDLDEIIIPKETKIELQTRPNRPLEMKLPNGVIMDLYFDTETELNNYIRIISA